MRDPLTWAVNLPRVFGIPLRVHLFFFLVTGGLFLRQVADPRNLVWWGDVLLLTVVATFVVVLLHELGHCVVGRLVGGEPQEILIWPLGGLATVDVPQTPKATVLTAAGGPAMNLILALLLGMVLAVFGFSPNPNPFANPYTAELKHRDGKVYSSEYALKLYERGTAVPVEVPKGLAERFAQKDWFFVNDAVLKGEIDGVRFDRAQLSTPLVWVYRVFWLNCLLLFINLLPAYPLDGGQILLGAVWARTDHRQGVAVAAYMGFVVGVVLVLVSFAANEVLVFGLAAFMMLAAHQRMAALDHEEVGYGDFSQGYTSLERDDPPARPRPREGNPLKRWLKARAARRLHRELEQQQADDERMDQLLEKIARLGKTALTDEERRFMERVSARYRDR